MAAHESHVYNVAFHPDGRSLVSADLMGIVKVWDLGKGIVAREMDAKILHKYDSGFGADIGGVRSMTVKPIVRRIRTPQGAAAARGLELTVLIDDKAFEGSGAFLMGAALDRFFAEYVAINHFTQTVVRTTERGEIMRWPPRLGLRGSL